MSDPTLPGLRENVPLAAMTTLGLGGHARYLVDAEDDVTVEDVLRWSSSYGFRVTVVGGGSNVVIADGGVPGLVLRIKIRGFELERRGETVGVSVGAGEIWDEVVARSVDEDLAGLECLSGIPGTAGATPIQNVGAYGQEVSQVIQEVRVIDRVTWQKKSLSAADCGFGYRTSSLRVAPDRFVVLGVVFELRAGGGPSLEYPELARKLSVTTKTPGLSDVREAVVELRRGKSMTIEAGDPNRRSVGSFFVNPVVARDTVPDLAESAAVDDDEVPHFQTGNGLVKIPAAWLIEQCAYRKGLRRGGVGISSRHSLALVHHGGATTEELVALAREVRGAVRDRFGIDLKPEPTFLGFDTDDPTAGGVGL